MSSVYNDHGIRTFQVDRRLVQSGALARLSGDALRLFLFFNYEVFTSKKLTITCPDARLFHEIKMRAPQIRAAANELQLAGLIVFEFGADRTVFSIVTSEVTQILQTTSSLGQLEENKGG